MKYILSNSNGWTVTKQEDGTGLLHIIPKPNSIFSKERFVILPHEMMVDIENGMTDINELSEKHEIYSWITFGERQENIIVDMATGERIQLIPRPRINTKNCYQGADFFVTCEGDKYFFKYLLSRQGGRERKFEISKEIYEDARKGDMDASDIFKKYNLYHLDIPENDVE
jgi:hypothetical protein